MWKGCSTVLNEALTISSLHKGLCHYKRGYYSIKGKGSLTYHCKKDLQYQGKRATNLSLQKAKTTINQSLQRGLTQYQGKGPLTYCKRDFYNIRGSAIDYIIAMGTTIESEEKKEGTLSLQKRCVFSGSQRYYKSLTNVSNIWSHGMLSVQMMNSCFLLYMYGCIACFHYTSKCCHNRLVSQCVYCDVSA